jgi:sulfatase maturation enzyme AslB (radical SAM superfamily)
MAMTLNKIIPRLDLMIAYSCNISCTGCISLSDRNREGVAPYTDIVKWVDHWSKLITPTVVTIFGGEPCLHPKLIEVCQTIRLHWPNTIIRLITNGYLLKRFDSASWFNLQPFEIQVSIHRADHKAIIISAIKSILAHRTGWKVSTEKNGLEHHQMSWQTEQIKIFTTIFKDFVVPFKLVDKKIKPWMSDPAQAHKICGAPNTPVLYKGKIYKCPAVANAMDLSGENWFEYQALDNEVGLDNFIDSIGRPETVCGQCPDKTQAIIIDHFDKNNVIVKQKNIS